MFFHVYLNRNKYKADRGKGTVYISTRQHHFLSFIGLKHVLPQNSVFPICLKPISSYIRVSFLKSFSYYSCYLGFKGNLPSHYLGKGFKTTFVLELERKLIASAINPLPYPCPAKILDVNFKSVI